MFKLKNSTINKHALMYVPCISLTLMLICMADSKENKVVKPEKYYTEGEELELNKVTKREDFDKDIVTYDSNDVTYSRTKSVSLEGVEVKDETESIQDISISDNTIEVSENANEEVTENSIDDSKQTVDNTLDKEQEVEEPVEEELEVEEQIVEEVVEDTQEDISEPVVQQGQTVNIDGVLFDLTKIEELSNAHLEPQPWDIHGRIDDVPLLRYIFRDIFGYSEIFTDGLIGNIMCEDSFMATTNSSKHADNLQQALGKLSSGGSYGICQWLTSDRKKGLSNMYNHVSQSVSDFKYMSIIAETMWVRAEVADRNIKTSGYKSIEDATGTVGINLEAYGKSKSEWYYSDGAYHMKGNKNSRYKYAQGIYDLYNN